MSTMKPLILVHGGAGRLRYNGKRRAARQAALDKIAQTGYEMLKHGNSALDTVVEVVRLLEDNPLFNAGYGAALGLTGEAEMDAAVMTDEGQFGAVAAIKNVKNPVLVARKVMEETDHILLVGEGATKFARIMGFEEFDPITDERRKMFSEQRVDYFRRNWERFRPLYGGDTVGAIAIDCHGKVAVAASTGGIMFHLPGRVGDTPLIGCGIYASSLGACAATGHGECIAINMVSKTVVDMLSETNPQTAADKVINKLKLKNCNCGVIVVSRDGNYGVAYNTPYMGWTVMPKLRDSMVKD